MGGEANHIPEIATMAAVWRRSWTQYFQETVHLSERRTGAGELLRDIQKIRFNDKFTYSVEMEEGLERYVIRTDHTAHRRKFGSARTKREKKEISGCRLRKNGVLCIEVTDDGCGAPKRMEAINHRRQEQLVDISEYPMWIRSSS